MLRGFAQLTWLEIKIFVREPLGVIGTVVVPVALFLVFGRVFAGRAQASDRAAEFLREGLPILVAMFIALGAALSLSAVIAIYREGGILKRLRATPLRPVTILAAHVVVKLVFTALTLGLMVLAGRRFTGGALEAQFPAFAAAVLLSTLAVLTMGFVIASVVPTARFAQPIGSVILYPMLALSGAFQPVESLPPAWEAIARVLPLTHAVALLRGALAGASGLDQLPHAAVLVATMVACIAVSARIFRWE